jgi:hypothetical protein
MSKFSKGNMSLILEGLHINRVQEDYSDLFESLREDIPYDEMETTYESFFEVEPVDEAKTVTFANSTYPKENWAVIMAGGSGLTVSFA